MKFAFKLCRPRFGVRDICDVHFYVNNYVGLTLVLFGFGFRTSLRIRHTLKDFTDG